MAKTKEELEEEKTKAIEEMNKVAEFFNEDFERLILIDTSKCLNSRIGYNLYYIHILGNTEKELEKNVMITAKGLQYFDGAPEWAYWNFYDEIGWSWYKFLYRNKDDDKGLQYLSFRPEKYFESCKDDLDNALEKYMYELNKGKKMKKIFKVN